MTIRDQAHCISTVHGLITCNQVQELSSKQEEADTKIFLCAKFAVSLGFESAFSITVDSDVAIFSIYYQHRLDLKLFLQMATGSKGKIFDIQTISVLILLTYCQQCMLYPVAIPPPLLAVLKK